MAMSTVRRGHSLAESFRAGFVALAHAHALLPRQERHVSEHTSIFKVPTAPNGVELHMITPVIINYHHASVRHLPSLRNDDNSRFIGRGSAYGSSGSGRLRRQMRQRQQRARRSAYIMSGEQGAAGRGPRAAGEPER